MCIRDRCLDNGTYMSVLLQAGFIQVNEPGAVIGPVINKNKQIMNGEMMEYMVGRRGISMDVLTRMKIEERLEFLRRPARKKPASASLTWRTE